MNSQVKTDGGTLNASLPDRLEKTDRQLSILMRTFGGLDRVLSSSDRPEFEVYPDAVVEKASKTAELILSQVDNIIEDMVRWGLESSPLEASYSKCLDKASELADANATLVKMNSLPHVRYGATLHRVGLNEWVAVMGSGETQQVLGKGPTAQAALNSFDMSFLNGVDPEVLDQVVAKKKRVRRPKAQ